MSYAGCARSAEENLGSDTKFGNRVGGAEPEKEGSPTSNRLWACLATRSHCWEFCCLARDDVGLAIWIFSGESLGEDIEKGIGDFDPSETRNVEAFKCDVLLRFKREYFRNQRLKM